MIALNASNLGSALEDASSASIAVYSSYFDTNPFTSHSSSGNTPFIEMPEGGPLLDLDITQGDEKVRHYLRLYNFPTLQ